MKGGMRHGGHPTADPGAERAKGGSVISSTGTFPDFKVFECKDKERSFTAFPRRA